MTRQTNLFWTGGWDSTFRLLQLLLIEKRKVQPYYLIDPERKSTIIEMKTMREIRNRLYEEYPFVKKLLLPTQFMNVLDIKPDSEITEAYQTIKKQFQFNLGSQYDWLSRFCKLKKITDMEVSIDGGGYFGPIITSLLELIKSKPLNFYESKPEFILCHYFKFPILNIKKISTINIVKEQKWTELMNMTWFCFKPRKGITGKIVPCGMCSTCYYAVKDGFGWRLPLISRFFNIFYSFYKNLKIKSFFLHQPFFL